MKMGVKVALVLLKGIVKWKSLGNTALEHINKCLLYCQASLWNVCQKVQVVLSITSYSLPNPCNYCTYRLAQHKKYQTSIQNQ